MAIADIGSGTNFSYLGSYGTTHSLSSFTVGAGANSVIYGLLCVSNSISGVTMTWDGLSMTQVGNIVANTGSIVVFRRVAPNTGNNTLSASWTGSGARCLAAIALSGVDQSTPEGTPVENTGTGTAVSTGSVTTGSGDATIGFACCHSGGANTSGFTTPEAYTGIFRMTGDQEVAAAATWQNSETSSANHTFTADGSYNWAATGFRVMSASAPVPPFTSPTVYGD